MPIKFTASIPAVVRDSLQFVLKREGDNTFRLALVEKETGNEVFSADAFALLPGESVTLPDLGDVHLSN